MTRPSNCRPGISWHRSYVWRDRPPSRAWRPRSEDIALVVYAVLLCVGIAGTAWIAARPTKAASRVAATLITEN